MNRATVRTDTQRVLDEWEKLLSDYCLTEYLVLTFSNQSASKYRLQSPETVRRLVEGAMSYVGYRGQNVMTFEDHRARQILHVNLLVEYDDTIRALVRYWESQYG